MPETSWGISPIQCPVPRRVLHDEFFKRAKAEGYRARSAYKLKELNERFRLIRPGSRVLDLGCAPGAWLQVAVQAIGTTGVVVGVDLQRVAPVQGAVTIEGDVYELDPASYLAAGGGEFDAVLSDMAPSTTGAGDDFVSARLCRRALEIVPQVLKRGGSLAMKVLEGAEYPALVRETASMFEHARGFKPRASRGASREMYVVGTGFRGRP